MAIRRTLKQKQKAQLHRSQAVTYSLPQLGNKKVQVSAVPGEPSQAPAPKLGPSLHEIFGYAPGLLWKDILKTLITTVAVVGILLALKYVPYFQPR